MPFIARPQRRPLPPEKRRVTSVTSASQSAVSTLDVVTLRRDHIAHAVSLSSALGWPYREEDWRFAFELGVGSDIPGDRHHSGR